LDFWKRQQIWIWSIYAKWKIVDIGLKLMEHHCEAYGGGANDANHWHLTGPKNRLCKRKGERVQRVFFTLKDKHTAQTGQVLRLVWVCLGWSCEETNIPWWNVTWLQTWTDYLTRFISPCKVVTRSDVCWELLWTMLIYLPVFKRWKINQYFKDFPIFTSI